MDAVIADLTSNPPQGLHFGTDWSLRYKLSLDQRLSSHKPVWEARRVWHVHAEVSLQSVAADAEFQKINVLLTHEKAGRSGLVLKGVDPIEDITAVLYNACLNLWVQRDDGSVVRPKVAVVLHSPSSTVLGSALSLDDNLDLLEITALANALRSTSSLGIDESSKCLPYHISKLQIDRSARSEKLIKMALIYGIHVTSDTRRHMGRGSAMRILEMNTTLGLGMGPEAYRRKSKSDIMTLATFKEYFRKYCEI